MKTILYYFTGTGNSLAVAEGLTQRLGDCDLVPLASLVHPWTPIPPGVDGVGIVGPVYFYGLPSIVADFAGLVDLAGIHYVFAVVTMGGAGGSTALRQLDTILQNTPSQHGLDAGFSVRMPGNYVLMYDSLDANQRRRVLEKADRRIDEIGAMVTRRIRRRPPWSPFMSIIHHLMYPRFIAGVHDQDKRFKAGTEK